ncbi:MAG: hypothetical protein U1F35_19390 [Steroidobacteraceae bacterium]
MGAHGIMVPHVDSARAREVVEEARFAPGVHAASPPSPVRRLLRPARRRSTMAPVVVQIEDAMRCNAWSRSAVQGVDAIFVKTL